MVKRRLTAHTWAVCRLLRNFFDFIFVETVGVGQSEIDIRHLADLTVLVLQPFSGDQVQFLKSGIMEIPDAFIISKCDEEILAKKSYYHLQASLDFLQGTDRQKPSPVFLTSALNRKGIAGLADYLTEKRSHPQDKEKIREEAFLEKAIRREYGNFGLRLYRKRKYTFPEYSVFEQKFEIALSEIEKNINRL